MSRIDGVLISCEHGGNDVPAGYRPLFRGHEKLLASHRGWDPGALHTARFLADALGAPLFAATVTRLLVDLNRSPDHPCVFSDITRPLPEEERAAILRRYYAPHRERIAAAVEARVTEGDTVLHLAVHSFTPVLDGQVRRAELGLLYDPARPREARFCAAWKGRLDESDAGWHTRRNYPYRGVSDGLTTALRRRFGPRYLGIELEINQRFFLSGLSGRRTQRVRADLAASLAELLEKSRF